MRINNGLYEKLIEPRLDEIAEWAKTMTAEDIARNLGVGKTSFFKYKKEKPELQEALTKGRRKLVTELYSTLVKRAKGFQYEERKQEYEDGILVSETVTIKTALPDVGSIHLLLKNYDKENWSNDPNITDIKRKELELAERKVENAEW